MYCLNFSFKDKRLRLPPCSDSSQKIETIFPLAGKDNFFSEVFYLSNYFTSPFCIKRSSKFKLQIVISRQIIGVGTGDWGEIASHLLYIDDFMRSGGYLDIQVNIFGKYPNFVVFVVIT